MKHISNTLREKLLSFLESPRNHVGVTTAEGWTMNICYGLSAWKNERRRYSVMHHWKEYLNNPFMTPSEDVLFIHLDGYDITSIELWTIKRGPFFMTNSIEEECVEKITLEKEDKQ